MTDLSLAGHAGAFALTADAKRLILDYLASTRAAVAGDPDGDETARDIETAIGDRLHAHLGSGAEIDEVTVRSILDRFGPLEAPPSTSPAQKAPLLCRIDDGKQISGLCLGLATRADLRVDWVRGIAVILGVFTGGLLIVVYLVALLFAPRVTSVADYQRLLRAEHPASTRDRTTKRHQE